MNICQVCGDLCGKNIFCSDICVDYSDELWRRKELEMDEKEAEDGISAGVWAERNHPNRDRRIYP